MSLSMDEVRLKLEAYCAYQERCLTEVKARCALLAVPSEWHEDLITHLRQNKFLDEERFAESYVSGKFRIKKWGRRKIYSGLKQKGISVAIITQALQSIDTEAYDQLLNSLAEKKMAELLTKKGTPWERKVKLMRYLIQRGFETDLVSDALDRIIQE